ncbi:hypothetical protein [Paenibacillus borealis]|nr:hypothetical protein [Paenibacillus borealis]
MKPCREPDRDRRLTRNALAGSASLFMEDSGPAADRQGVLNAAA